ncbi:hypothetical protein AX16_003079 [Volvariella volvacea WC 439]|nr:hypothetical protein AX16_003079 [Volvariella volvacea WC 439]
MILHLEAGTCPSGATRTLLNQYIYTRDVGPGSLVTTQPYYEENYDILDSYSWNSDMGMWQCDLCPYMFGTIGQMKQHLMGPRHREKIFRCPNLQCGVQFRSLSGVFQHVEKEACGLLAGPTIRVLLETVLKDPEWMFE